MRRPVIGVTTWPRPIDTAIGLGRAAHTLGVEYTRPVEAAGAAVVLLAPTAGAADVLERLDGLILSGGDDVTPSLYGGAPQPGYDYSEERDRYEIALAHGARERQMPTLAICRGLQIVNVAFGGSLVTDLPQSGDHVRLRGPE